MEALGPAIAGTEQEAGSKAYYFFQSTKKYDNNLYSFELFDNKKALGAHAGSPHFIELSKKMKGIKANPPQIDLYRLVEGFVSRAETKSSDLIMVANVKVKKGTAQQFIDAMIKVMKDQVVPNEPETLTYVLLQSAKDADQFTVFERYASKDAIKAHGSSAPFIAYVKSIKHIVEDQKLNIYVPSNLGFLQKNNAGKQKL